MTYKHIPQMPAVITNADWYRKSHPGFDVTGDLLVQITPSGEITSYVVFKGDWTPAFCCRDCGDHFIIARYSRYDCVWKSDLREERDVEDY